MADEKTFTKAELDAAIAESKEAQDAKNKELLDELKKVKADLRKSKDIDPADLTAAEERAEKAEAKAKELEKAVGTLTKERDAAVKKFETETGFTSKLLVQDGLKSALIANGVKDEDFIDSLSAKFASGATVKIDGETRTALIGDKPLADAIKEWAGTDAGKKFVAAPANGGGGAPGSAGNGGGGKTMTRSAFDALDAAGKMSFSKDGGKVVDATA